jgi:xylulokinase
VSFLGVDVGTTGAKALLVDAQGNVKASATHEYPMYHPRPLWAEQDPHDWWEATLKSIEQVADGEVEALGLTGQMHGLVLLDGKGEVLRPCIMWNDQRTAAQCAAITARADVLRLTGNAVLPGFTAPKIVWVREHEPDIYARVAKVLLPKDYVRHRLTGEFLSDVSDASGTALFDVQHRAWSDAMLDAVEVPRAWLPEVTESAEPSGRVRLGPLAGTPVVGGAGDQAAQAVGAGIVREGIVSVTLGTSGVVFAASDTYRVDPRLHSFCHAVQGMWHLMGVMLSAGGSLRWYRDAIGSEPYDRLTAAAAPTSDGVIFLPYLSGERTPHPDPHAKGVFFGLTLRHTKAHLTRAVLEGVAFGLRDSLELMRAQGLSFEQVRVSGGGAKSALWCRILADVFNTEIVTVRVTEGAAYGAALLAMAQRPEPELSDPIRPGPDAAGYEETYRRYRALYPALAERFRDE